MAGGVSKGIRWGFTMVPTSSLRETAYMLGHCSGASRRDQVGIDNGPYLFPSGYSLRLGHFCGASFVLNVGYLRMGKEFLS